MMQISVLDHKVRGEDQIKKVLRREILNFVVAFTRVFRLETRLYSDLVDHKQYCFWGGAQAPKCTPVAPGQLLFLGAKSLLGRGTFLAWGGTGSDLGHGPEMSSVAPRLSLLCKPGATKGIVRLLPPPNHCLYSLKCMKVFSTTNKTGHIE